jgi:hypothetical protein
VLAPLAVAVPQSPPFAHSVPSPAQGQFPGHLAGFRRDSPELGLPPLHQGTSGGVLKPPCISHSLALIRSGRHELPTWVGLEAGPFFAVKPVMVVDVHHPAPKPPSPRGRPPSHPQRRQVETFCTVPHLDCRAADILARDATRAGGQHRPRVIGHHGTSRFFRYRCCTDAFQTTAVFQGRKVESRNGHAPGRERRYPVKPESPASG